MASFIKNKEILSKDQKYFYFIPCYDVINNEIYFFEFLTERIVTKPKQIIIRKKSPDFNPNKKLGNLLTVGKILKKAKDKIKGKKTKTNLA